MKNIRNKIWLVVTRKHHEGMILPLWLLIIRAILFPLDFFYWKYSLTSGYQWQTDTWKIHGVRYSGSALIHLAESQGEVFKITRKNGFVTLERLDIHQHEA